MAMAGQAVQAGATSNGDVLCRAEGACGRITLNRPGALNALTNAMRADISAALSAWQRDPMIYAVVFDADGDRAFCAGGDLRELGHLAQNDIAAARASLAAEYALNWQIEVFTKPTVSLIDGICMGSGVGLTAFGTHRVAGARYGFAMPEVSIGFFPDVGATRLLTQLPQRHGLYLGLSGRTIGRGDALELELVTHCIAASRFDDIRAALSDAEPVDAVLDGLAEPATPETPAAQKAHIESVFGAGSIAYLLQTLDADRGPHAQWSAALAAELRSKSPTSLAVTHEQLSRRPPADLREGLVREYRQACRLLDSHDLHEGVRALLIEKDKNPQWNPLTVQEIDTCTVQSCFEAPGSGDLELPPRPQAIAAIA